MDRQPTVLSLLFNFLITPENVVPIASRLIAFERAAFKRNAFSRKAGILQSLRKTLYYYQSNRILRQQD